jgi:RNA polymerase-binding transcription factor DksA
VSATALDELEAEARARFEAAERELSAIRLARSTDNADDEHDPEGSTLSSDWSRAVGMRDDARTRLAEIDAARERVAAGSYGICERCGRPIPAARLEVRPTATTCVACAR